jgi:ubiquinone/menaquinone biosynthesis C-methylase UbiE
MANKMTDELRANIIAGNIEVHRQEAVYYDQVHGEIFNWFEQWSIRKDLSRVMRLTPGRTALDVGCGTGNITLKLLKSGFRVTAIDLSLEMLDVLVIKAEGNKELIRVKCQDIDSFLQESPGTFDVITISSVLHHLPDYLATLSNLLARINPGGCIYITHEPSGRSLQRRIIPGLLHSLDYRISARLIQRYRCSKPIPDYSFSDYHVFHGFSSSAVMDLVHDAGFTIVHTRLYSGIMYFGINSLIDNWIFRADGQFSLLGHKQIFLGNNNGH